MQRLHRVSAVGCAGRRLVSVSWISRLGVGLLFSALVAHAAEVGSIVVPDDLVSVLHGEVERAFKADEPGAVVIVVRDGQVLLRDTMGMANLELAVPMRPEMVFRLGSVTKQFTAAAILLLVQQGRLSLDDDINKYLPDYPNQGQRITIAQLLTHTAGITSYTDVPAFWRQQRSDLSSEELLDFFKNRPMDFVPGERWHYSNSGYAVLGALIEKVSGQGYGEFVEQHIFQPLGMVHSSLDRTDRIIAGRVPGYKKVGSSFVNADYMSMTLPYAAGALLSTVDDLALWDAALYTDGLVSQDLLQRSWLPAQLRDGRDTHYAFGWLTSTLDGLHLLSHAGGINGFSSMVARVPATHVYVAVLTNREGGAGDLAIRLAVIASGREWHAPTLITLSTTALDRLVGTYRMKDGGSVAVAQEAGSLVADVPPYGKQALAALSETDFLFFGAPLARLAFQVDPDGVAHSLSLMTGRGPDELAVRVPSVLSVGSH